MLGVGQANGPRPFQAALTSTHTSPFWSRMAHTRVCDAVVDALGNAPTEKRMMSMTVGSGTQSSGPVVARGGAKQGS